MRKSKYLQTGWIMALTAVMVFVGLFWSGLFSLNAKAEGATYVYDATEKSLTLTGAITVAEVQACRGTDEEPVEIVTIDASKAVFPEDSSGMFADFRYLEEINFTGYGPDPYADPGANPSISVKVADTSNVKNMSRMFSGCHALEEVMLIGLDTSKVENMSYMFDSCFNLEDVYFGTPAGPYTPAGASELIDTSKVKTMEGMFTGCKALTSVDMTGLDLSEVTTMQQMFTNCTVCQYVRFGNNNLSDKLTNMQGMFAGCEDLEELLLNEFDTSNVTNRFWLFARCTNLTEIIVGENLWTNTTEDMFSGCGTDHVSYARKWTVVTVNGSANVSIKQSSTGRDVYVAGETLIIDMVPDPTYKYQSITIKDSNNNPVENITITHDEIGTSANAYVYKAEAVMPDDDVTIIVEYAPMDSLSFDAASQTLYIKGEIFDKNEVERCSILSPVRIIAQSGSVLPEDCNTIFYGFDECLCIDLVEADTSKMQIVSGMFMECHVLETIRVSDSWDVSGLSSNYSGMFNMCFSLVGQNGTAFNSDYTDGSYAVIDKEGTPGYLSSAADPSEAVITGAALSLDGVIRLRFRYEFSADLIAEEGAYITFEKSGKQVKKMNLSEGTLDGAAYVYSLDVNAKEFADDITAKIYHANGDAAEVSTVSGKDVSGGFTYSVATYIDKMSRNAKMSPLLMSLYGYCISAQKFFQYGDYESLNPSRYTTSYENQFNTDISDELTPYALTSSGNKPAGLSSTTFAASFDADNSLRVSYVFDEGVDPKDYTYKIDNQTVSVSKSGSRNYLMVSHIPADELMKVHTFEISNGTDTYTINCSILSYAKSCVINGNEDRQVLGKSMFLYAKFAKEYFEN